MQSESFNKKEKERKETFLFVNESPFGAAENAEYQRYSVKKSFRLTMFLCVPLFIALGLLSILWLKEYVLGGVLLALSVIYVFLPIILMKVATSKKYEEAYWESGLVNIVKVDESGVQIFSSRGGISFSEARFSLAELKSADFHKGFIYLYIAKHQAYVIYKDKFTVGDCESFLRYLGENGVKINRGKEEKAKGDKQKENQ